MAPLNEKEIKDAFGDSGLNVFTEVQEMTDWLNQINWKNKNLLLMTSGTFANLDINLLSHEILS
jgi:UDP-N-acetylmuramate: L-alanyl-gamma-D-glutamyl-meso-diaminopimelate ligase